MSESKIKLDFKIDTTNFQKGIMHILRGLYQIDGLPYGDTEEGFQKWVSKIKTPRSDELRKKFNE